MKLCNYAYIACDNLLCVLLLSALNGNDLTHFLNSFGAEIICLCFRCEFARYNLKEGHFSYKRVCNGFEADCRKRSFVITGKNYLFSVLGCRRFACVAECAGYGPSKTVKKLVNTCRRKTGNRINGIDRAVENSETQAFKDFLLSEFLALEEFIHKSLVCRCDRFHKRRGHFLDYGVVRNVNLFCVAVCIIFESHTCHKVYIAFCDVALHIRNDCRAELVAVNFFKSFKGFVEISVVGVCFCNRKEFGNSLFLCCVKRLFRADVNARACRGNYKYSFSCPDSFGNSALKVKKTGSVDYIKFSVVPFNSRHSGRNRRFTASFLSVEVENGISFSNFTKSVGCACNIKHCFAKGGFTFSAVADNGNVSDVV